MITINPQYVYLQRAATNLILPNLPKYFLAINIYILEITQGLILLHSQL